MFFEGDPHEDFGKQMVELMDRLMQEGVGADSILQIVKELGLESVRPKV